MNRAIYSVLEGRKGWMIRLNGKAFGPTPSRDFALGVARRAAQRAYEKGVLAHVLIYDGERFRTVWANGKEVTLAA